MCFCLIAMEVGCHKRTKYKLLYHGQMGIICYLIWLVLTPATRAQNVWNILQQVQATPMQHGNASIGSIRECLERIRVLEEKTIDEMEMGRSDPSVFGFNGMRQVRILFHAVEPFQ